MSPGQVHTCGLDADSLAWCWDSNSVGQLGIGCAVTMAGVAYCWGSNQYSQLGGWPIAGPPAETEVSAIPRNHAKLVEIAYEQP